MTFARGAIKNGETRYVPMNEVVMETFRRLPTRLRSEYVFVARLGIPINPYNFYGRGSRTSGFTTYSIPLPLGWRSRGFPHLTNKKLMGTRDIRMTLRYAHLAPGHLKEAVEGLCRGINSPEVSQIVSQGDFGVDACGVTH